MFWDFSDGFLVIGIIIWLIVIGVFNSVDSIRIHAGPTLIVLWPIVLPLGAILLVGEWIGKKVND